MCNKTDFYEKFKTEFAQRPFDQNETLLWLNRNKIITMSWGFNSPTSLDEHGLMFKVNGHHHKGWVLVTLAGNDTYTLRFLSAQFKETKAKITEVYCDVLQETVDNAIERIESYSV
ncbi:hypothetical protein EV196_1131 [Mariniflexile fucanivorans]|uniref:Uncharacterized protein n=1 Tax=Mariniflexile fucanivorans TaxID=264023 RepID=A0A4R1RA48_9FLAO|nr:hypothetical protein [Mariniflexile fucanivorans]TCL62460.1 hypothetical protein EV196_1131 [Mariniflexile fucanivorans]